ncbi:hypothetical protein RCL1_001766 [Eukaryota sp. TZLM3-RCL]
MTQYSRSITDPVYQSYDLPKSCFQFIDTPEFQRLRDIKQLSTASYVFPTANHTRFDHSLGVAHLARSWATDFYIKHEQPRELRRNVDLVTFGALLHDIGHCAFSHSFDGLFLKKVRPEVQWTHEMGSVKLFEKMVDDYNLDFTKQDANFIEAVIHGQNPTRDSSMDYYFQIVSNSLTSVDVDKFDYILRDCLFVGLSGFKHNRIVQNAQIINGSICFDSKTAYEVHKLFNTRYDLFKEIYSHRVGKAVELMICDAFIEADQELGISAAIDDMDQYLTLTDSILYRIEHSTSHSLSKAREIIKRIKTRKLYAHVGEVLLSPSDKEIVKIPTEEDISSRSDGQLFPSDLIVNVSKLSYASAENIWANLKFYKPYQPDVSFTLSLDDVSKLGPTVLQEYLVHVFVRDPSKRLAAATAATKYFQQFSPLVSFKPSRKSEATQPISSQHSNVYEYPLSPPTLINASLASKEISMSQSPVSKPRIVVEPFTSGSSSQKSSQGVALFKL